MDYETGLLALPDYMRGGLRRWIDHGIPPGDFLTALPSNDLRRTFEKADSTNQRRVLDYIKFLYSDAPRACWGSPEAVTEWEARGGLLGPESEA
jgi:hypothetical protein